MTAFSWKARQTSLDRPVAIKILPPELGVDQEFRASFEAEAKAMARLNHPNLIAVYDFGEVDGLLFIVMEYVDGKSLHDSAFGKAIDPAQAAEIVSGICRGLDHAHSHDVLHRDIKPGNILLDADATPKIGDFGLALPIGDKAGAEDVIYGTPGYTAPEVYEKAPATPQADIFSVGVLLHELLTGALPDERRSAPSTICGSPRDFDAIFSRATSHAPAMRYSSAADLADALDKAKASKSSKLNAGAGASRLALSPASVAPQTPRTALPKKSAPLPIGFIAAAVGVAVIVAAAVAMNGGSKDKKSKSTTSQSPDYNTPDPAAIEPSTLPLEPVAYEGGQDPNEIFEERPESKPSPVASLAALKEKLASGSRDEFPPGIEELNGSQYLLVDQAMTWREARKFAENHGAHLAVLPSTVDRKWFHEKFQLQDPAWLGGGIAARESWQWIDGSQWNSSETPAVSNENRSLVLSPEGALAGADGAKTHHFAIQWPTGSGKNPATIAAELGRTADTMKSGGIATARLPVGTRTNSQERSHYLAINTAMPWDKARKVAEAAGGYLAVPSLQEEKEWIGANFASENSLFWIGSFRIKPTDPWRWVTREAWVYSGWIAEPTASDPRANRGIFHTSADLGKSGWMADDAVDGAAMGMLIEWSEKKQPADVETFDLDSWLAGVDRKIKVRVGHDVAAFERERDATLERYMRAMRREARKRKSDPSFPGRGRGGFGRGDDDDDDNDGDDRGRWGDWSAWRGERAEKTVEEEMAKVEESSSLESVRVSEWAPSEFKDLHEEASKSLAKLTAELESNLTAHSTLYSGGLTKQADLLKKSGFVQAADQLDERATECSTSTNNFLEALGFDTVPGSGDEEVE